MMLEVGREHDVDAIRLPRWGRVAPVLDGVVPFVVLDDAGQSVEAVQRFLHTIGGVVRRPTQGDEERDEPWRVHLVERGVLGYFLHRSTSAWNNARPPPNAPPPTSAAVATLSWAK